MIRKLERKFGRFAIPGLMKYIIFLYAAGYAIWMINPGFYFQYLMFDVDKVLSGQVWRIVTFLIQPTDGEILFLLISLFFYYWVGTALERQWGSFRFNLYYFSGILFNLLFATVYYVICRIATGVGTTIPITLHYLNLSLFLAFAVEFSETKVLFMMVIPIKMKYLAIVYVVMEGYDILKYFIAGEWGLALLCIMPLMNFLIFFFMTRNYHRISPQEIHRRRAYKQGVMMGQQAGPVSSHQGKTVITRHRCAVCGRTELDGDELEFRFCSKCDGNFEYCMDHLYTHTHVVREEK